jgi:hypothetical protein
MKKRVRLWSLALPFLAARLLFSSPVYIADFSSFPAYPYNTTSYRQGGAYVGCGPTTGAMILAYFQSAQVLKGLLDSPGSGTDKGLNTAWALHGSAYMNTQTDGNGDVYRIKPGIEDYAKSKGCTVKVVIHVSPTYTNPNDANWVAYGAYGDAWTNDGNFWKQNAGGAWSIDTDKFCDFAGTELAQGIPIFLTIDTKAAGTGDHWVPLIGYDKAAKQYAYYDTYDTSVHWADIYYTGDPAGKKANSIAMVRTVAFVSAGGGGGGTGTSGRIAVTTTSAFGAGSLGDAIAQANTHAGMDTVVFNIPKTDGGYNAATGVWTIAPTTGFQGIGDAGLVIDGFSQRDFIGQDTNPDGPEIQVIGTGAPAGTDGLYVTAARVEISGLTVCGFRIGIALMGVKSGRIAACYVGTNAKGDHATPNQNGIWLGQKTQNVVIEPAAFQPSLVSGNSEAGIVFADSSLHNVVLGCLIGMDRTEKAAIPNGISGIFSKNGSYENVVNGNHIGGNRQGIYLTAAHGDTLVRNWIGTDPSWLLAMGNSGDGVLLDEASYGNVVVENLIGRNGGWGIHVVGQNSVRNKLIRNSVSLNTGGGIFNESGGNAELAAPVIAAVTPSSVAGTAAPNALVQIFTDPGNQGAEFQSDVLADPSGHFSWNGSLAGPFHNVTAVAVDATGNTSAFSGAVVTDVQEQPDGGAVPRAYSLFPNYPNPFNPSTTLSCALPYAGKVLLIVCDPLGRRIRTLADGVQPAGLFQTVWDGLDERRTPVPSGVYIYRLDAGSYQGTGKMLLLK